MERPRRIQLAGPRPGGLLLLAACAALPRPGTAPDPSRGEVPLGSRAGWNASLVFQGDAGIWTVESFPVFDVYGSPEVVGLDDRGRCEVLISYSGKWTPRPMVHDGAWLGGLAHGDVDPRIEGAELYTGGKAGNLYQLVAYREGVLDDRRIAHLPGSQIHTLVALPARHELLVFTSPGALFVATPSGADGSFEVRHVRDLPGRVRDAVLLPRVEGDPYEIATVSRAGRVELLTWGAESPRWSTIDEEPMGFGRIALAPDRRPAVLYTTLDDGRVLRHERLGPERWRTETIHVGSQGPRGIAAGRFDADGDVETVALFGYGAKVELLRREAQGWSAETIFVDVDKGHWLAAAELDGRNATRELLASGYGGRIVLLARPPGYGIP